MNLAPLLAPGCLLPTAPSTRRKYPLIRICSQGSGPLARMRGFWATRTEQTWRPDRLLWGWHRKGKVATLHMSPRALDGTGIWEDPQDRDWSHTHGYGLLERKEHRRKLAWGKACGWLWGKPGTSLRVLSQWSHAQCTWSPRPQAATAHVNSDLSRKLIGDSVLRAFPGAHHTATLCPAHTHILLPHKEIRCSAEITVCVQTFQVQEPLPLVLAMVNPSLNPTPSVPGRSHPTPIHCPFKRQPSGLLRQLLPHPSRKLYGKGTKWRPTGGCQFGCSRRPQAWAPSLCPQLLRGPRVRAWWRSHTHHCHTGKILCLREKVRFGHKDTVEEVLGNLIFNIEKLEWLKSQ